MRTNQYSTSPYTYPCNGRDKSTINSTSPKRVYLLCVIKFSPRTRNTSLETIPIYSLQISDNLYGRKTLMRVRAVLTAISLLISSIIAFLVSTELCAGWLGLGLAGRADDEPPPKNDMTRQQSSKTFLIDGLNSRIFSNKPSRWKLVIPQTVEFDVAITR